MKHFVTRPVILALYASGLLSLSTQAMAAAFQLWEQDGASFGNYHAGYAASAEDASTAWYNPAGITRFKNQQIVLAGLGILSDFRYRGSVGITELSAVFVPPATIKFLPTTYTFNSVTAQGGAFAFIPALHYVAPLNDRIGFGFSIDAPFGLKTSYGSNTPFRYAATTTSITVVDISPSLGFKVTDKASLGLGFDVQKAYAEFDSVGGLINPETGSPKIVLNAYDTTSTNKANDTGYGYHLGVLYDFTPETRVGLSYHSQVVHHFSGSSKFIGPIADLAQGIPYISSGRAKTNVKLPPYTALSLFHQLNPSWALMGTAIYTKWDSFKMLTLNGVSGAVSVDTFPPLAASNNIQVTIPQYYRNTWNLALGANYYPTETIILRGGVGYDQSPVVNAYRNAQLPDNDRYVVAMGGHFQATKTVGLDVGWMHVFIREARINPPPQVNGAETVSISGHVNGGADLFSGQITWDIV